MRQGNLVSRPAGLLLAKLTLNCMKKRLRWQTMCDFGKFLSGKFLLPAMIVAVAQWLLVPSFARASCGDYVLVGGHRLSHSGAESATSHARAASSEHVGNAPAGPCHCSGPQCSQNPPRPFGAPVAPVVSVTASDWGIVEVAASPVVSHSRWAVSSQDLPAPHVAASAIYRPPR